MKLIKITMELGIDTDTDVDTSSKEAIADLLSTLLYEDPEFFGGFGPENIESITEID